MAEKRYSHAYLLTGPQGGERIQAARRLAAEMMCTAENPPCGQCRDCRKIQEGTHPDVITIEREMRDTGPRADLVVDQIREMVADAAVAPNEGTRKVYIIAEADRMNTQAQNALLKALEDPPGHACFILCASSQNALLNTVRSRCLHIEEGSGRRQQEEHQEGLSEMARAYLEAAASGDLAQVALCCMSRSKLNREDTENFADEVKNAVWQVLSGRAENPGLETAQLMHMDALMDKVLDCLRHNVSSKQIFGLLTAETLR